MRRINRKGQLLQIKARFIVWVEKNYNEKIFQLFQNKLKNKLYTRPQLLELLRKTLKE